MIKIPVEFDKREGKLRDGDLYVLAFDMEESEAEEIVKRVNIYEELIESLDEICDMWFAVCNAKGWDENHMSQYERAKQLLEKLK